MHGFGFRVPVVESARDANSVGRRMSEFKANGHELGAGTLGIIVVMIMFHEGEFVWRTQWARLF
jgi:hypothetical protein